MTMRHRVSYNNFNYKFLSAVMGISNFAGSRAESRRMVQGGRGSNVNSPRSFSVEQSRR